MPPRHGKSELISVYFCAWYICNFPSRRVIFCTYSDEFASTFGRRVLALVKVVSPVFGFGINKKKQCANEWETTLGGGMVCVGIGGSITGRGSDLFLIDDAVKNFQDALSKTSQNNMKDFIRTTVFTRFEPGAKMILIMTRWQPDDLTQVVKDSISEDKILHLVLKAIADENDLYREQGEALWEARYPLARLNVLKELVTDYWFNCMYQQNPTNKGSEFLPVNKFGFYQEDFDNIYVSDQNFTLKKLGVPKFCTVDLAISEKESADFFVQLIFRVDSNSNVYIENCLVDKFKPDQHEEVLIDTFYKYSIDVMGIESVAYQETIIHRLRSKGLSIDALPADADKMIRLLRLLPHLKDGKIFLKENQPWIPHFLNELAIFPYGKHDDQVDAFSYVSHFLNSSSSIQLASGSSHKSILDY